MKIRERERELLVKASDLLYSLSCRTTSKREENTLQNLAYGIDTILYDNDEEDE